MVFFCLRFFLNRGRTIDKSFSNVDLLILVYSKNETSSARRSGRRVAYSPPSRLRRQNGFVGPRHFVPVSLNSARRACRISFFLSSNLRR
ncbi:hypothetical protein L596_028102 [Steinernema carpocapsae]|uniref:Uncharacterized protein n=1 Tax=Steinernema carpocapsae TaxID=34508 RepID=A0A4U5LXF9_STECR|nr:hypothetical protein L596_028102 [Steinernema carpocapsae]